MKIALIPIDNRPVCYTLPEQVAAIDRSIELFLPDRNYLGDLKNNANIDAILDWLKSIPEVDAIVISLDTVAYGGLIPSRRSKDSFEQIKARLEGLKEILSKKNTRIYAFSSIMRISNNNINEEEKEYWSLYGKNIFDYSFNLHKSAETMDSEADKKFECFSKTIPCEIIEDYLSTRKRNFEINRLYLEWVKDNVVDTLVYSKDDCAEFGLNVKEANLLKLEIDKNNLNALVKTGADEIPLSLMARAIVNDSAIKIAPVFMQPDSVDKISKYEDVPVLESVNSQIELAGAKVSNIDSADLILYVNNFKNQQGEIVMGVFEEGFSGTFEPLDKPYFIADILNANGADNNFVEEFFKHNIDFNKFYGYAAWNTTGNTLGSVICSAVTKFLAKDFNPDAFKKLQMIRFLDDWAYQANVRQAIKQKEKQPNIELMKNEMKSYESKLNGILQSDFKAIKYGFPWDRFFETEVTIQNSDT